MTAGTKHMSHPDRPDHVVEAGPDREKVLASVGWRVVTRSGNPKKDES
jgi:hypothetical protein